MRLLLCEEKGVFIWLTTVVEIIMRHFPCCFRFYAVNLIVKRNVYKEEETCEKIRMFFQVIQKERIYGFHEPWFAIFFGVKWQPPFFVVFTLVSSHNR